jgi:hypothetical protein
MTRLDGGDTNPMAGCWISVLTLKQAGWESHHTAADSSTRSPLSVMKCRAHWAVGGAPCLDQSESRHWSRPRQ